MMTRTASRRFPAVLVAALSLLAAGVVFPQTGGGAGEPGVGAITVRYRDAAVDARTAELPPPLRDALVGRLGSGFSVTERNRDGAFTLRFDAEIPLDAARAAINRVRMDANVLYAGIAPTAVRTAQPVVSPPTNRLVVRFRDPAIRDAARAGAPLDQARLDRLSLLAGTPVAHVRSMGDGASVLQMLQRLPIDQVEAIAARIAAQPDVDFAQPDYIDNVHLVATDPCYASASVGECVGGYQWDLFEAAGGINVQAAWDITTGSTAIAAAVVDTGALFGHPDLSARFIAGYDFVIASGVVSPNDGDDRDADASDPGDWYTAGQCGGGGSRNSSWHGTHVAGTIGAQANNGGGVAGINWVSRILPVRVLGRCGGYSSDIADGMRWAAGGTVAGVPTNVTPARAINLSIGGARSYGSCDALYQSAITDALSRNAVVVVSAGNSNVDAGYSAPANCPGAITVAATSKLGYKAYYSNYNANAAPATGNYVDIAAPGGDLLSHATYNPGGYGILSSLNSGTTIPGTHSYAQYQGTSMAAPHVTGVASLMLSIAPGLTPAQVLSIVQTTARAFPVGAPACAITTSSSAGSSAGWFTCQCTTTLCGAGIVNAAAAVAAAQATVGSPTTTSLASSANPSNAGAAVTLTATVNGTSPTGTVAFTDDGASIAGCGAVSLSGAGNARTAQCVTPPLVGGSHAMVAAYSGDVANAPSSSSTLTQTVNQAPAITSAASTAFTVGAAGTFTVTATGYPAPTFTRSGALPAGVTFTTTTGVLSGTPAAGTGGVYPLTIGATNGVGSPASQSFTLTVSQAPAITSAASTAFTVGAAGTFTVTATGYPAPTYTRNGALPAGVTFNTTTGVLSGTPAAGTGGVYPLTIGATNGVGSPASQSFTLTVSQAPAITSAASTAFTVGAAGTFTVTATGYPAPTLARSGALPTGVTFNTTTGALSGTPAAGTGGVYPITFGATNGVAPDASQSFMLTVNAAPGPCVYSLSPLDLSNAPAAGGPRNVAVTTSPGCPVTAVSFQPWVTVVSVTPGSGTSVVALQIDVNGGGPRATSIRVADRLFLVTQLGP